MLVTRSFACRAREGLMAIGNDWVLVEQVLVVNLAVQGVLESEHVHRVDFHLGERDVACHNDGSLVLTSAFSPGTVVRLKMDDIQRSAGYCWEQDTPPRSPCGSGSPAPLLPRHRTSRQIPGAPPRANRSVGPTPLRKDFSEMLSAITQNWWL